MRKITRLAALAFRAGNTFNMGSTSVQFNSECWEMRLHGNLIAWRHDDEHQKFNVTLAGWGTPTTRERVNGLLEIMGSDGRFYQRDYDQHFAYGNIDAVISDRDWFEIRV